MSPKKMLKLSRRTWLFVVCGAVIAVCFFAFPPTVTSNIRLSSDAGRCSLGSAHATPEESTLVTPMLTILVDGSGGSAGDSCQDVDLVRKTLFSVVAQSLRWVEILVLVPSSATVEVSSWRCRDLLALNAVDPLRVRVLEDGSLSKALEATSAPFVTLLHAGATFSRFTGLEQVLWWMESRPHVDVGILEGTTSFAVVGDAVGCSGVIARRAAFDQHPHLWGMFSMHSVMPVFSLMESRDLTVQSIAIADCPIMDEDALVPAAGTAERLQWIEALDRLRAATSSEWRPGPTRTPPAAITFRTELPGRNTVPRVPGRKRLLMIIPWMVVGGADRFNVYAIETLIARGWDVTVAATLPAKHVWEGEFLALTKDVFKVHYFINTIPERVRFLTYLMRSRQPDVVMVTSAHIGYAALPILQAYAAQMNPSPVIVDYVHMVDMAWRGGGYAKDAADNVAYLHHIMGTSLQLSRWVGEHGVPAERRSACYIGVDTRDFVPSATVRAAVRQELQIAQDQPVILYSCRITQQKQPLVFADTILQLGNPFGSSRLPAFTVIVAGSGDMLELLRERLQPLREHPLIRVLILGEVSAMRVRQLMQASDILFLPSELEGVALVQFEAMSTGMVFVGSDVGGQGEVITPDCDCGHLIQRSTPAEEAVQYQKLLMPLLADSDLRARVGAAARKRIQDHFDLRRLPACLENVFAVAQQHHTEVQRLSIDDGWTKAAVALRDVSDWYFA